jgi:hypothetical protein
VSHSLNVTISAATAQVMRRLRSRYETAQESARVAFSIAAVVVDAWENGWPVVIERPNGSYRLEEVRNKDQSRAGHYTSAVRPVYLHPDRARP